MMSSVITVAFENWKAQEAATGKPVLLNEFVFANVPGLDPTKPIDRNEKLPPANQIVHRQAVNKAGLASENAVAYSVTLGAEVGNFDFNWIGLLNKESGTIAMITHAPTQKKLKTQNGQQGNVLTRSFLLEFQGAAAETQIKTSAETWQIDFTARLSGIDEMQRLINVDSYGAAAFFNDGFEVTRSGEQYTVKKGLGYVGGLRGELAQNQILNGLRNTKVYADFSYQGNIVSQWNTVVKITSAATLNNYVDAAGFTHQVFAIASIDGSGNVKDLRPIGALIDQFFDEFRKQTKLDLNGKIDKSSITGSKGNSTTLVVNQNLLTTEIGKLQISGDYADKNSTVTQTFKSAIAVSRYVMAADSDYSIGLYADNGMPRISVNFNGKWVYAKVQDRDGTIAYTEDVFSKVQANDRFQEKGDYATNAALNKKLDLSGGTIDGQLTVKSRTLSVISDNDYGGLVIGRASEGHVRIESNPATSSSIISIANRRGDSSNIAVVTIPNRTGTVALLDDASAGRIPIGGTIAWHSNNIPSDYLPRDGRSFDKNLLTELAKIYPDGKLPNDSALYYRMVDNGRGIDKNRVLGSEREDSLPEIKGSIANGVIRGDSTPTGVFYASTKGAGVAADSTGANRFYGQIGIDISRVTRTNTDNEVKVRDRAIIWITRVR
ncbi:phage tail protein [Providencia rettgeri]